MDKSDRNKNILEIFQNANRIGILPNKLDAEDSFSAGTGMYYLLTEKFHNKDILLVYPGKIPEKCENLMEKDKILTNVSERDLMVSIDYSDTPAAKVQYSTDKGVLYLKVSPINADFDKKRVKTEITGSVNFDVLITIGAQMMEDFGQTFKEMETEFYSAKIVNIDNTDRNLRYGNYNYVDPSQDTLSLMVLNLAGVWGIKVTKKAGKALLTGITYRDTRF